MFENLTPATAVQLRLKALCHQLISTIGVATCPSVSPLNLLTVTLEG